MKCTKVISKEAELDIKEIALWYNAKQKGLGKKFVTEVRIATNYIVDYPEAFQPKYDQIRLTIVAIFPYAIHYFFDQNNNIVLITGVYRDSRDPNIWNQRL